MELIVLIALLVLLDILAMRFGVDSRRLGSSGQWSVVSGQGQAAKGHVAYSKDH